LPTAGRFQAAVEPLSDRERGGHGYRERPWQRNRSEQFDAGKSRRGELDSPLGRSSKMAGCFVPAFHAAAAVPHTVLAVGYMHLACGRP
jgi:hypothetical protein